MAFAIGLSLLRINLKTSSGQLLAGETNKNSTVRKDWKGSRCWSRGYTVV